MKNKILFLLGVSLLSTGFSMESNRNLLQNMRKEDFSKLQEEYLQSLSQDMKISFLNAGDQAKRIVLQRFLKSSIKKQSQNRMQSMYQEMNKIVQEKDQEMNKIVQEKDQEINKIVQEKDQEMGKVVVELTNTKKELEKAHKDLDTIEKLDNLNTSLYPTSVVNPAPIEIAQDNSDKKVEEAKEVNPVVNPAPIEIAQDDSAKKAEQAKVAVNPAPVEAQIEETVIELVEGGVN